MIGKIFHNTGLLAVLLSVLFLVVVVLFSTIISTAEVAMFLAAVIVFGGGFAWFWFYINKEGEYFYYNEKEMNLYIYKAGMDVSKFIKILNENNYSVSYKPKQLHIGAVTTGGFTVGGIYETGGYDYISSSTKMEKYYLAYDGKQTKRILKIILSEELTELAKKSSYVSRYLSGNKISLLMLDPFTYNNAMNSMLSSGGASTSGVVAFHNEVSKNGLSIETCQEILSWLYSVTK